MRKMNRAAAIFSILMGVALSSTWIILFAIGQVPEISTKPFETSLLLTAEFLTAASLIGSGYGVLTHRRWGQWVNLVAMGMLLYCVVNYIGVLAEQGTWPAVAFFSLVTVLTVTFITDFLYHVSGEKAT